MRGRGSDHSGGSKVRHGRSTALSRRVPRAVFKKERQKELDIRKDHTRMGQRFVKPGKGQEGKTSKTNKYKGTGEWGGSQGEIALPEH